MRQAVPPVPKGYIGRRLTCLGCSWSSACAFTSHGWHSIDASANCNQVVAAVVSLGKMQVAVILVVHNVGCAQERVTQNRCICVEL